MRSPKALPHFTLGRSTLGRSTEEKRRTEGIFAQSLNLLLPFSDGLFGGWYMG